MERTEIEQIWPAHADHISYYKEKFVDELFTKAPVVAQRKYDGERMLIHFLNGKVYCTSRRISKKTGKYQENQDRLAHLPQLQINYTVIDCECYADTWSEAAGVLHSLPERALELQKNVNIRFACFDCLFFNGEDLREMNYAARRSYLVKLLDLLKLLFNDSRFHLVEEREVVNREDAYRAAQEQWDLGREGVVIKALNKTYYDKGAMLKIKRFETIDVVVYDYQPGNGKYEGTVGALYVGYYDAETDSIKHVSKVNCGSDAEREMWMYMFDHDNAYGKVIEVLCQEITEKSLRHPRYVRLREDKDMKMCTRNTIFKE